MRDLLYCSSTFHNTGFVLLLLDTETHLNPVIKGKIYDIYSIYIVDSAHCRWFKPPYPVRTNKKQHSNGVFTWWSSGCSFPFVIYVLPGLRSVSTISTLNYLCTVPPLTTGLKFECASYSMHQTRRRLNTNATRVQQGHEVFGFTFTFFFIFFLSP